MLSSKKNEVKTTEDDEMCNTEAGLFVLQKDFRSEKTSLFGRDTSDRMETVHDTHIQPLYFIDTEEKVQYAAHAYFETAWKRDGRPILHLLQCIQTIK